MKVYVYKEYEDGLAYGEELIKVFANLKDAEAYFRKRVKEYFRVSSYEEAEKEFLKPEYEAYVGETEFPYLSIRTNGYAFFVVSEYEVLGTPAEETQ